MVECENYQEAANRIFSAFAKDDEVPDSLVDVFESLDKFYVPGSKFWNCIKALKVYYDRFKTFPVEGIIPDFHTDTKMYIRIKNAYDSKAKEDRAALREILNEVVGEADSSKISDNYLKTFSSHWSSVYIKSYKPIQEEFDNLNSEFIWEFNEANKWYFCIRAADEFFLKNNRLPNPKDQSDVRTIVESFFARYKIDTENFTIEDKYIEEM